MMLKYYSLTLKSALLTCCVCASSAFANPQSDLLAQVSTVLNKPAGLQVSFSQTKQLKGFKAPVVSSGRVLIAAQRGMLWMTESPYQSVLKITPSGLSELRGGQTTQMGNAQSMKSMSAILSGMLSGDFSPLQRYFRFSGQTKAGLWQLSLKPVDANVARAISSIQMSGGRYVNRVVVHEANGDTSIIRFSGATPINPSSTGL